MPAIIERSVVTKSTVGKILHSRYAVSTSEEHVLMGVLHEERRPDVQGDKQKGRCLSFNVLHFLVECIDLMSQRQAFSFIAFMSNLSYL